MLFKLEEFEIASRLYVLVWTENIVIFPCLRFLQTQVQNTVTGDHSVFKFLQPSE